MTNQTQQLPQTVQAQAQNHRTRQSHSRQSQSSRNGLINVSQAVFGSTFGLWYVKITQEILLPTNVISSDIFNTNYDESFKFLYIFASLVIITMFAFQTTMIQKRILEFPIFLKDHKKANEIILYGIKLFWRTLVSLLFVWGFFYATSFFYPTVITKHIIAFIICQTGLWLILDFILSTRN